MNNIKDSQIGSGSPLKKNCSIVNCPNKTVKGIVSVPWDGDNNNLISFKNQFCKTHTEKFSQKLEVI